MGQKIKPTSFRLGITENWRSRWWPKKNFKNQLEEDFLIRNTIKEKIKQAGIISIEIERTADNAFKIGLKVARPGLVIGRGGKGIEDLSKLIETKYKKLLKKRGVSNTDVTLSLNVEDLKRSETSATYMAQVIAWDIEKRMPARRIIKKYLGLITQSREVGGAKIRLAGRINGAEIARKEVLSKGKLPLQTLRANIDYGEAEANNTYGVIGVKVWIYKGEIFDRERNK